MSRPFYETHADLANEHAAINALLAFRPGVVAHKLTLKYQIDYGLYRGRDLVAFVEVKQRTCSVDAYATYALSFDKFRQGMSMSRESGSPFMVLVRWSDAIGWWSSSKRSNVRQSFGGRVDRGDAHDVEPMALLPIADFKVLRDAPLVVLQPAELDV